MPCRVPAVLSVPGESRISDPAGHGPSIWFHAVPDAMVVKNRLHLDIRASGEWTARSKLAGSESTQRPAGWPAWAPPSLAHCPRKGSTTTRSE
jgi:hypothetical protein